MMKNNAIKAFLFSLIFLASGVSAYAQNMAIKLTGVTVKSAMTQVEKASKRMFVYKVGDLDTQKKINVDAKTLEEAVRQIVSGQSVTYEITGNNIVISRVEKGQSAKAFGRKITGTITDAQREPVIGANVVVMGNRSVGTITDYNGTFNLEVPADATLEVTYMGYNPAIVKVGSQTHFDIALSEDTQTIDEVVVVGYGTQKKVNLTGAVSAVNGDDIARRPVANANVLLQGQIPGLYITQGTGQPGEEEVSIRVRGQGTYSSAGSDPLVLINGVPGSLSALDPSVIESVSVLKDAASAAIYGARAANGVILVTTKQGSADKVHLKYHGNVGIHTPSRQYDLVTNSVEYMELANLAWKNSGAGKSYAEEDIELYRQNPNTIEYPSFDWQDYCINPATVQNHNITMTGGGNNVSYNIALNYMDQPGTIIGFNYDKYNATIDLTAKINDRMRFGTYSNLNYKLIDQPRQGQEDTYLAILSQEPCAMPWLPDDGSGTVRWEYKAYSPAGHNKNIPAIVAEEVLYKQRNYDINTQMWLEIELAKGLTWYTKGAARLQDTKGQDWRGEDVPVYFYHTGVQGSKLDKGGNGLSVYDGRTFYTNLYSYLKYDLSLQDKAHNISAMLGYNQENEKYETLSAYRKEYAFPLKVIDAGGTANWTNGGTETEWAIQSIFGRFNYNYMERYLFEANFRYDGTSRIAAENRWGFFPSFSAGWRVTEEPWMQSVKEEWMDNLKIRASWGQLGNQNIGTYPYQAMISSVTNYPFGESTNDIIEAYQQTAYANRNLKWETTTITDIGFDWRIFKNLGMTFDWYKKRTTDILRQSQVSATLGFSAPYINDGVVDNTGFELAVDYSDVVTNGTMKGLRYNGSIYFDHFRNELVEFGADEIHTAYILREGLPYKEYYMLECIGVFATEEEVANSPKQYNDNTLPGDLKYRDANGDNVINDEDKVAISGRYPKFEYGINLGADWKGIDFSLIGQGIHGIKHYTTGWGVVPFQQGSAPTYNYVNAMWTEDNPYGAKHPRIYYGDLGGSKNTRGNSYFLKDASFFRLKNLTVGYTLPKSWTDKTNALSRVRVYFSGDNLCLITPWEGLDPERPDGNDAQYPQNTIYSFGLNVEF